MTYDLIPRADYREIPPAVADKIEATLICFETLDGSFSVYHRGETVSIERHDDKAGDFTGVCGDEAGAGARGIIYLMRGNGVAYVHGGGAA